MPTQIDQRLRRIQENEVVLTCVRNIPDSVPADGGIVISACPLRTTSGRFLNASRRL